jgi:hypothetical protein
MSSMVRNIQRALKRGKFYMGRGSQLGVKNPKVKTARSKREARNEERI